MNYIHESKIFQQTSERGERVNINHDKRLVFVILQKNHYLSLLLFPYSSRPSGVGRVNDKNSSISVDHSGFMFVEPPTWCFPGMTRSVNYSATYALVSPSSLF